MEEPAHPLAVARKARRLTQDALAAKVRAAARLRGLRSGTDRQRVRKWERGTQPDEDSQFYIADALELPADIVRPDVWPTWLPLTTDGVVPLGPHSTVPALREALRTAMDRRDFLTISGAALAALAADWAAGSTAALAQARDGKPVDDRLITMIEESARQLAGLATEQRQHTAVLLDAHLTTVTELLEHGRPAPTVRLRLHALAASLSQTVAWNRFDLGRHTQASQYWIAGLHSANAMGDHDLGAGLLSDLAYQAAWRHDHTTAASILTHALTRAQHPAARALLHLRLARTLAAQQERRPALRALTAAEKHLSDASTDRPAWCAWMSEADLAVDSGQALLDLGDTGRAHQLIAEGESLLPPARDKTRGVFLTYRAASYLSLNDPEPAAAAATESLILARRIGAPRCANLVRDLLPRFQPYRHAQGVPELLQLAAA
ncbi:XRE family transcriptional regulator [Streptomyces phaeochromogenes]|uniref:XRE family transcriptional regulator n=1 Tax=Streptomyces phaeochromogenes TaxID=1923 RepID=UPI002DD9044C|nr:XRE family transcriptional regulator [Streptomyces phaeochromogenes]WRZ35894.1 XRE family transcriptional regulator [Streptomyces phaeochromogenes]